MMSGGENPNNDIVAGTVPDGISSISWSPKSNIFVATSWDNQVHWRNLALASRALPLLEGGGEADD
jgi:hypothetical protein